MAESISPPNICMKTGCRREFFYSQAGKASRRLQEGIPSRESSAQAAGKNPKLGKLGAGCRKESQVGKASRRLQEGFPKHKEC